MISKIYIFFFKSKFVLNSLTKYNKHNNTRQLIRYKVVQIGNNYAYYSDYYDKIDIIVQVGTLTNIYNAR